MYQALYRKYRPIDFDSVVGQDVIVKTLVNSIVDKNFSHAYMFFGPRGTGKTTVSKIFARNINCLKSKNGLACGKCESCKVSFSHDCIDIIEIDAASNNGVDEIRELKNKISLVPSELKYKVYIIDEVHMLSIGAFNALLKTLEEPPEHAIFILATTDPQKVPETIVSRCQCFSFSRIAPEIVVEKLVEICSKEKIKIEKDVLENIAMLSDGGMRDALGMLDKLVSYSDEKITMKQFSEVNAIVLQEDLEKLLGSILEGNTVILLNLLNLFDNNGKNLIYILIQLLNYIRNLLVSFYVEKSSINYSDDKLLKLANYINECLFDIKRSGNVRIYVEICLLKFINDNINIISVTSNENRCNNELIKSNVNDNNNNSVLIEKKNSKRSNSKSNYVSVDQKILNIDEIMKIRINNTLAAANKTLLKEELKLFELLKDYTFDPKIGYIACALLDSKVRVVSPDSMIISFAYDSNVKQNLDIITKLSDTYNKITSSNKLIAIISDEEWNRTKDKYIVDLKNNIKYEILKEPEVILEEIDKDDIISNDAIELFGDIVEVE